jgi:cytoskeletal protein CcmA (bactofilin family)
MISASFKRPKMFGKSKISADVRPEFADARPLFPVSSEPPSAPASAPATVPVEPAAVLDVQQAPAIKPSIISDAVNFVGEFRSTGALHIDGNAKGTIEAESVTVGTGGSLEGTVSCKKLHVQGSLQGDVTCDELIISDEGQVAGALSYKTILVQRGARVAGKFSVI